MMTNKSKVDQSEQPKLRLTKRNLAVFFCTCIAKPKQRPTPTLINGRVFWEVVTAMTVSQIKFLYQHSGPVREALELNIDISDDIKIAKKR